MSEQGETPAPTSAADSVQPAQTNGIASATTAPVSVPIPVPVPVPEQTSVVVATPPDPSAQTGLTTSKQVNSTAPQNVPARARTPAMNGQQANINGHAAIQRGLELLAETESSQTNEEIKKLDTQLDYFNKYLDKYEKRNAEVTERLSTLLQQQKQERATRRASFMQKEEQLKAERENFDKQLNQMFAKCAQMRRQSAPVIDNGNGVGHLLEESRHARGAEPIPETNGHDGLEDNGHDEIVAASASAPAPAPVQAAPAEPPAAATN